MQSLKKRMGESVFCFISPPHRRGLAHRQSYFRGMIIFSRAKITLREVTRGCGPMWEAVVRRSCVDVSQALGCSEICNVLSEKQFIDSEAADRSRSSLPAGSVLSSLLCDSLLRCQVQAPGHICAHTRRPSRVHAPTQPGPVICPSIHFSCSSNLLPS